MRSYAVVGVRKCVDAPGSAHARMCLIQGGTCTFSQVLRSALAHLADLVPLADAEALATIARCTSTLLLNWGPPAPWPHSQSHAQQQQQQQQQEQLPLQQHSGPLSHSPCTALSDNAVPDALLKQQRGRTQTTAQAAAAAPADSFPCITQTVAPLDAAHSSSSSSASSASSIGAGTSVGANTSAGASASTSDVANTSVGASTGTSAGARTSTSDGTSSTAAEPSSVRPVAGPEAPASSSPVMATGPATASAGRSQHLGSTVHGDADQDQQQQQQQQQQQLGVLGSGTQEAAPEQHGAQVAALWQAISGRLQALLRGACRAPRTSVTSMHAVLQVLERAAREGVCCSGGAGSDRSGEAVVSAEGVLPCPLHFTHAAEAMQAQPSAPSLLGYGQGQWLGGSAGTAGHNDATHSRPVLHQPLLSELDGHSAAHPPQSRTPLHLHPYALPWPPGASAAARGGARSTAAALPFVHAARAAVPVLLAHLQQQQQQLKPQGAGAAAGSSRSSGSGSGGLPQGRLQQDGLAAGHHARHAAWPLHTGESTSLARVLCMYVWHRSHWGVAGPHCPQPTASLRSEQQGATRGGGGHWGGREGMGSGSTGGRGSGSSDDGSTSRALRLLQALLPHVHKRITSQLQHTHRARAADGGVGGGAAPQPNPMRWSTHVWCREVAGLLQASCMAAHALALPLASRHAQPPLPPPPQPTLPPSLPTERPPPSPLTSHPRELQAVCGAHVEPPPHPPPHPLLHLMSKRQPLPVPDILKAPTAMLLHVAEMAACGLQVRGVLWEEGTGSRAMLRANARIGCVCVSIAFSMLRLCCTRQRHSRQRAGCLLCQGRCRRRAILDAAVGAWGCVAAPQAHAVVMMTGPLLRRPCMPPCVQPCLPSVCGPACPPCAHLALYGRPGPPAKHAPWPQSSAALPFAVYLPHSASTLLPSCSPTAPSLLPHCPLNALVALPTLQPTPPTSPLCYHLPLQRHMPCLPPTAHHANSCARTRTHPKHSLCACCRSQFPPTPYSIACLPAAPQQLLVQRILLPSPDQEPVTPRALYSVVQVSVAGPLYSVVQVSVAGCLTEDVHLLDQKGSPPVGVRNLHLLSRESPPAEQGIPTYWTRGSPSVGPGDPHHLDQGIPICFTGDPHRLNGGSPPAEVGCTYAQRVPSQASGHVSNPLWALAALIPWSHE